LVVPDGLEVPADLNDFKKVAFPKEFFQSRPSYNRLCLSESFYAPFEDFDFILIYQLDCLVLKNELSWWCDQDIDYIGAPWFRGYVAHGEILGVGNGGFSLRKTKTFLNVLRRGRLSNNLPALFNTPSRFCGIPVLDHVARGLRVFGPRNNVQWHLQRWRQFEDAWWSFQAARFIRRFRIPDPQLAMKFSMEIAPRFWFEQNGCNLPFGCHAWSRWDRSFWEPFLLH
jgi:hypothetical protein